MPVGDTADLHPHPKILRFSLMPFGIRFTYPVFLALVPFLGNSTGAIPDNGYRLHTLPERWEIREPTPAFDPDEPDAKLGELRKGIEVNVRERRAGGKQWLVEYPRRNRDSIFALIDVPNAARITGHGFDEIRPVIDDFPLLRRLLEAERPWPETLDERLALYFPDGYRVPAGTREDPQRVVARGNRWRFWGIDPITVAYDRVHNERPRLIVEVWTKGEAFRRPDFRENSVRNTIRRNLEHLVNTFDPGGDSQFRERVQTVGVIREGSEIFLLPNDIRVSFRHERDEYMILEIESADNLAALEERAPRSREELREFLESRVATTDSGHVHIDGIPMVNQGDKGYCVVASMARVFNFYGLHVDMHGLARLAGTLPQRSFDDAGGTFRADALNAMQRSTINSPFRRRDISSTGRSAQRNIRRYVDRGIPVLWVIPGHMNLIIGYHPENDTIVYSDSWGPGHEFKVMPWEYFERLNLGMWVLEP